MCDLSRNAGRKRSNEGKYLLDDADSIGRNAGWILHVVINDAVKHHLLIFTRERRLAGGRKDAELGLTEMNCGTLH